MVLGFSGVPLESWKPSSQEVTLRLPAERLGIEAPGEAEVHIVHARGGPQMEFLGRVEMGSDDIRRFDNLIAFYRVPRDRGDCTGAESLRLSWSLEAGEHLEESFHDATCCSYDPNVVLAIRELVGRAYRQ